MMRRRKHPGFTLLELLLAMFIAVILSVSLYVTLNTAIKARRTAQAVALSTRPGSIAMDLICHDLESVVRPAPSDDNNVHVNGVFQATHRGGTGSETDDLLFNTIAYEPTADRKRIPRRWCGASIATCSLRPRATAPSRCCVATSAPSRCSISTGRLGRPIGIRHRSATCCPLRCA